MKQYVAMLWLSICLMQLCSLASASEIVKAPKGWKESQQGNTRIVSNGNASVLIGPWTFLRGVSADKVLQKASTTNPDGGVIISSKKIKPENRVPGAFSVFRNVKFADSKGVSVLYMCPGKKGHARMLALNVKDGGMIDTFKGGKFLENVCSQEPKGAGPTDDRPTSNKKSKDKQTKKPADPIAQIKIPDISDETLRLANNKIPAHNRPMSASLYSEESWVGFPAMLITKVYMALYFDSNVSLGCSDWDPSSELKASNLEKTEDCQFDNENSKVKIQSFKPGERLDLKFGTVSAASYDFGLSTGGTMSGGTLVMSKDGKIAIGNWQANHVNTSSSGASSSSEGAQIGRYYLNGHTITIVTHDGNTRHGFIGYEKREGKIAALYLNGKHYWDRSKY